MSGNTVINDADLKKQMIFEASLILETVDFLDKEINAKLLEIESAKDDNKARKLASQVKKLLAKLSSEECNMDAYMAKYKKILNEKTHLLPNSSEEKQLHPRSISPDQRGSRKGTRL